MRVFRDDELSLALPLLGFIHPFPKAVFQDERL